jgi:uncharacterized protein (DUF2062 family)
VVVNFAEKRAYSGDVNHRMFPKCFAESEMDVRFGSVHRTFTQHPKGNRFRTDNVGNAMSRSLRAMRQKAEAWLRQGISPRRLALTLALGFAIGCIPVIGIPTALCLVVALGLRLNVPAIQAANYAAMPLQVALIFPFVRLGGWMFSSVSTPALNPGLLAHTSSLKLVWASGSLAGEALGAWLVTAVPAVVVITLVLTVVLEKQGLGIKAEVRE